MDRNTMVDTDIIFRQSRMYLFLVDFSTRNEPQRAQRYFFKTFFLAKKKKNLKGDEGNRSLPCSL